jgi:hypothetical protein
MKKLTVILSALFVILCVFNVDIKSETVLLFQAEIANQSLELLDGSDTYNITFSIWDSLSGGTQLWGQTITGMVFRKGTISALLGGAASPFPLGLFEYTDIYIQITLTKGGSSETLSPRMKITSSAYMIAGVETTGCEAGMVRVSNYCIDVTRRPLASEENALKACYDRGASICEWWQIMHACDLGLLDVNTGTALSGEWTTTAGAQMIKGLWGAPDSAASMPFCAKLDTPSAIYGTTVYTHYYRCCK